MYEIVCKQQTMV